MLLVFVTNTPKELFIKQCGVDIHGDSASHVVASLLLRLLPSEILPSHLDQHVARLRAVALLAVRGLVYSSPHRSSPTGIVQQLLLLDRVQPRLVHALEGGVVLRFMRLG